MPSHRVLLELSRRYTEPNRFYHGIEHIAWLLARAVGVPLGDEQVLAIWFHDAVYDVHSSTNEEDSADLAGELLAAEGWPRQRIEIVQRIVLDTKRHVPTIPEAGPVVDLDLAPLAVSWEEFEDNSDKLLRECASLGEAESRRRRRAFLEGFLARDRIYWTPWGEPMEPRARANLQRALDQLGAG